VFLYPPDMGLLNPLRWVQLASHESSIRYAVFVAAAVLAIGIGWFVRLAAHPRTARIALAAAAATGLIATLIVFSVLGPAFAAEAHNIRILRMHPVSDPLEWSPAQAGSGVTAEDANYLAQFHAEMAPENRLSLEELHRRAALTNRFYAAVTSGWFVLGVVLSFCLGLTLESTWAADYLRRSGRGPIACAIGYLELYPPVAVLLVWCIIVFILRLVTIQPNVSGGPSWGPLLAPCGCGAGLVTVAHVGVLRRWHFVMRSTLYLAIIGLGVACLLWLA